MGEGVRILAVLALLLSLAGCWEGSQAAPYPVVLGEPCSDRWQFGLSEDGHKMICSDDYTSDLRWRYQDRVYNYDNDAGRPSPNPNRPSGYASSI